MGVLGRKQESLRVRHQTENPAGWVAEAGDLINRTIWIWFPAIIQRMRRPIRPGSPRGIANGNLVLSSPIFHDLRVSRDETPFGMRDGEVELLNPPQEDVIRTSHLQMDPTGRIFAIVVSGERRIRSTAIRFAPTVGTIRQDPRLEQCLKSVTDPEHQLV